MSRVTATVGAASLVIFVAGATGLAQPGKQRGGSAPHPAAPAPHAAPAPAPHAAPPAPHFAAPAPHAAPPPVPHFAAPAPHAAPPPAPHFAAPAPHAPPAPATHFAAPRAAPQAPAGAPHFAPPGTAPSFTAPHPESHFAGPKAGPQFAAPGMRPDVGRQPGFVSPTAPGHGGQGVPLFAHVGPHQELGVPNGHGVALERRVTPDVVRRALGPAGHRPSPIAAAQGGANATDLLPNFPPVIS
jgi:hypothetical protein